MKNLSLSSGKVDDRLLEVKVKEMYRDVATRPDAGFHFEMGWPLAEKLGYSPELLSRIPEKSIQSFAGVGYFFHLAALKEGELVLDLGSGSGMDAFYAALHVGTNGLVNGVDITDEQLNKANSLALEAGFRNTRFRKSYIEDLPLDDNSIDVIISNGVINLSPDKEQVFREAARVLKPRGRLVLADIVSSVPLPENISCNATLWAACIGGAVQSETYLSYIRRAGFKIIVTEDNPQYAFLSNNAQGATEKYGIKSISLLAIKNP